MVGILQESDWTSMAATAKAHGDSEQTLYTWRQRFGCMDANDVKQRSQLELENARLKKNVAKRDFEIEAMKAIAVKNGERTRPPRLPMPECMTCPSGARVWCQGSPLRYESLQAACRS